MPVNLNEEHEEEYHDVNEGDAEADIGLAEEAHVPAEEIKWPTVKESRLPPSFANKFQSFIDFLSQHSNVIRPNSKDELVIDSVAIPNTKFSDLVRSMYVRSKNNNMLGFNDFTKKLYSLKANISMFSQKDSITALNSYGNPLQSSSSGQGKGIKRNYLAYSKALHTKIPPGKKAKLLHVFRM
ncbi:MAG: hypothetical protein FD143_3318 [Ignavibacteria bacterium]|nr:MAG: hypothetical protein FD143_3318 [Ignavibacteria bacterium]